MKKIVVFIVFLTFFFGEMNAQGDIRIGFQASPGISWLQAVDENKINDNGKNVGLKLGLLGEYYFRENYILFAGLGFSFNQGGTLEFDEEGRYWPNSELPILIPSQPERLDTFPAFTDLQYKIQYVEIPFGLKLKTKEFGYLQYYVEIPTFTIGFRSQAKGVIEGDGIDEDVENDDYVIKKEINPITMSWGLGAGVEYNISSSTAIVAGISYQRVFTDVLKDNNANEAKTNMNNLTLRLAVMF